MQPFSVSTRGWLHPALSPPDRMWPHHIARRHNLRLDATVRSGAVRAEDSDGVDGSVELWGKYPGNGQAGGRIRCRGPDRKNVFGDAGCVHRARRTRNLAVVPCGEQQQILRVLCGQQPGKQANALQGRDRTFRARFEKIPGNARLTAVKIIWDSFLCSGWTQRRQNETAPRKSGKKKKK